ncbi:MAG: HPF/RaiA family ribosome-associated protein [Brevundimonas sp.]|uniref:HPF/RaiA family ribosome-associated protein n=1 Tax=Brevundimonas sp. TaxID=1871086 RepID=UPI00391DAD26
MDIQINTANNVAGREAVTEKLEATVRNRLSRFEDRVTRIELHVGDVNGERSVGGDIRCQIEARPAGQDPLSVSDQADSIDQAATRALAKMATALDRAFGKTTNRKGH